MAVTVTVLGVDPVALPFTGETESQLPVPPVDTVAVQLIACEVLDTVIDCVAGAAPPAVCENDKLAGATDMLDPVTVRVTGTSIGLSATVPPEAVILTRPV